MSKYQEMGKDELRKLCKVAGIPYGKLNNEGMRNALEAKDRAAQGAGDLDTPNRIEFEDTQGKPMTEAKTPKVTPQVDALPGMTPLGLRPAATPEAGKQLGKALTEAHVEQAAKAARITPSAELVKDLQAAKARKIEKDRPEQNGIKMPSTGTTCRAVWDALDGLANGAPATVTAKQAKELGVKHGWNPNNVSIEFYQWRRFHGITGRQAKAK